MALYKTKPAVITAVELTKDNQGEVMQWAHCMPAEKGGVSIHTLEGVMRGDVGDFIIKGLKGEFYPCKADVFHKKYEKVE